MLPRSEEYQGQVERLFLQNDPANVDEEHRRRVLNFTFQVTDECNLCCTYCYQGHKQHNYMSFDTAKQTLEMMFSEAEKKDSFFSYDRIFGIVFDFIGGETLLNIKLLREFIEYTEKRMIELQSPWLFFHRFAIGSNGVLYFDPEVQRLLNDYGDLISIAITVDGTKKLHDSCRVFPNGEGSYDYALRAALAELNKGNSSTKLTFCPANINEVYNGMTNMLQLGFTHIHGNCVFEEGWQLEHATTLYWELKKVADYILDNNLEDSCEISIFDEHKYHGQDDHDNKNYCGGAGSMVAVDYQGKLYPCLRYMESSLNGMQPPLLIGDIQYGVYQTESEKQILSEFRKVTRVSQSEKKCLECPISQGCAWCSAYNYQKTGSFNKRVTFICDMHRAEALVNLYFWGTLKQTKNYPTIFKNCITDDIAIPIIGQEEWNNIKNLITEE